MRGDRFEPDNLKIEKGSIVEWRVISDESDALEEPLSSLSLVYSSSNRRHVIAFETPLLMNTESPLLRPNGEDSFKVRFLEPGHYPYRCQIFPRLRGSVSVFENVHQILQGRQLSAPFQPSLAVAGVEKVPERPLTPK